MRELVRVHDKNGNTAWEVQENGRVIYISDDMGPGAPARSRFKIGAWFYMVTTSGGRKGIDLNSNEWQPDD